MASARPPSYIKRDKTPALGAPTTNDRRLDQFLQNIHERIESINNQDLAAQLTTLRAQIQGLSGGGSSGSGNDSGAVTYRGEWDASSGFSPSESPAQGDYYVVSVAGTASLDGFASWGVDDWAVYNGTTWDIVRNTALAAGDNIALDVAAGVTTISSTASGTAEATPTYIPVGSTTTVAANTQMLYVLPITVDGTLTVIGDLVEVVPA